MEDNDKNLEQFFNKKFAHNIDPEPWNTPDEDIWTGIESDILRRKGHRRRIGLLLPLFFLTIGIGMAGYFYWLNSLNESKVKELQMQLEACGSKEKHAISSSNKLENITHPALITPSFSIEKNKGATTSKHLAPEQLTGEKKEVVLHDIIKNAPFTERDVVDDKYSDPKLTIDQFSDPKEKKSQFPVFEKTPMPSMLPFMQLLSPPIKLVRYFKFDQEGPVNKKQGLFQISAATEALFWKDRLNGKLDLPLSELLLKETVSNTLAYGVLVKKGISRHLSFDAGLLVGNRTNTSTYLLSVPYTLGTEHNNPDGTRDNEFHHSLPTGLGNVNTVLVLNRSANSNVNDQEKINLDFAFKQKIRSLFLPVKLTYYPKSVGKGFFGAIGLNTGFDLKNELSITIANSLHSLVNEKSISIELGSDKQRAYNVQGTINLGYQLPITRKLSATINTGYNHALINKYKSAGFSHKLDNWGIGFSINQQF